jgi:hypothetical protein
MRTVLTLSALALTALLSGCDLLGIESAETVAARKEAEGKAVGSACRHAMRAIEDCYVMNPRAQKSAVFTGWREMDEYMRENKIEGVAPTIPRKIPGQPAPAASVPEGGEAEAPGEAKPAPKGH